MLPVPTSIAHRRASHKPSPVKRSCAQHREWEAEGPAFPRPLTPIVPSFDRHVAYTTYSAGQRYGSRLCGHFPEEQHK